MQRRTFFGIGAAALAGTGMASVLPGAAAAQVSTTDMTRRRRVSVSAGEFEKIYDQSVGESGPWYINDHCFIRGADDTWHMFGITHAEPAAPPDEHNFAHATAPELLGPWTKQPFALSIDEAYGETHLWAPHVIRSRGVYHMFYCGGGTDLTAYAMNLATSKDLRTWRRHPGGPLFRDGYEARDPFVTRICGKWVMYYTANSEPTGGNHIVAYRTSSDLVNWSERKVAYTDPVTGTFGGNTESPQVICHRGRWYLFIGPRPMQEDYVGTDAFVSDDPFAFDQANFVGRIASHAAEVVSDGAKQYVSHCGWGQGGLYLAELYWT